MSENTNTNSNSRVYGIIVTVLLLLSAILGFFFWNKSRNAMEENKRQAAELTQLNTAKSALIQSLDSLTVAYSDLRNENESLAGRVAGSATLVQEKEGQIKLIKAQTSKDLENLRAQVAELQKTKTELETIINVLKEENATLKAENDRLTGENAQLKTDNEQLNGKVTDLAQQLAEQIKKTQSATFKASSFKVEVGRKGGEKMTGRAKRAREVSVSFDLADVPQTYQGPQNLYLVVTDDKGVPIKSQNPIKATINAPTGPLEIVAQQSKAVQLSNTQRHSFTHKLEDKLKAGNYVVAIYCDKGLLGASSFRLSK